MIDIPSLKNTCFIEFNLSDLLDQLGEDFVKQILSSFSCPLNPDVEYFLKTKAIEMSKRNFSKTYLVYWETEDGNDSLISGSDLLQLAVDKAREVQKLVGGRFIYLECEDKPKLLKFYTDNHFTIFGERDLDRDETDKISGRYLKQLFALM